MLVHSNDVKKYTCMSYVECGLSEEHLYCLFDLGQSTVFQSCRSGSFWVQPVLSKDQCVLLKHNSLMPVRLVPATPQSPDNHSTTESLRSLHFYRKVAGEKPIFRYLWLQACVVFHVIGEGTDTARVCL